MAKKSMGKWIDTLAGSVGKYVNLETTDGIQRRGKVTGFRMKTIVFNEKPEEVITEIELNGDPTDCVQIATLDRIQVE